MNKGEELAVPRDRSRDRTARRQIDVEKAFRDAVDLDEIEIEFAFDNEPDTTRMPAAEPVRPLAPLDLIPLLAVPREDVAWTTLDAYETKLLLLVDGTKSAMKIVTALAIPPIDGARLIASLARRGLVRLVSREGMLGDGEELQNRRSA